MNQVVQKIEERYTQAEVVLEQLKYEYVLAYGDKVLEEIKADENAPQLLKSARTLKVVSMQNDEMYAVALCFELDSTSILILTDTHSEDWHDFGSFNIESIELFGRMDDFELLNEIDDTIEYSQEEATTIREYVISLYENLQLHPESLSLGTELV